MPQLLPQEVSQCAARDRTLQDGITGSPAPSGVLLLSTRSSSLQSSTSECLALRALVTPLAYSGLRSIPTPCLPSSSAAIIVVPLPTNGSRTLPPVGEPVRMHLLTSFLGKGALDRKSVV